MLAAEQEAHDPENGYRVDVLIGDRSDGDPRLVLAAYLDTINRIESLVAPAQLLALFGEAARVLRIDGFSTAEAARRVFDLCSRHAREVAGVLDAAAGRYAKELRHGELPEGCTLRLAYGDSPVRIVDRPDEPIMVERANPARSSFPTPSGSNWADVRMQFMDGETVAIKVGEVALTANYTQLGFADGRNTRPNKQWELLRSFASNRGVIAWGGSSADRKNQKRRETLAKMLRGYFNIEGDPIELTSDGDGWRARFEILPD